MAMNYHLITVVWRKSFTDLFLRVVIPSQLSPNNLPAFKNERAVYKIYTTFEDAQTIKNSKVFKQLTDIISTEIIFIHVPETEALHSILSDCHKMAIEKALKTSSALIFLTPDAIFSDGSFHML